MDRSTVAEFVVNLLNSSTITHIMHLQTKSYSQHVALGDFYDGIIGLTDSFAEAYQGAYGVIESYPTPKSTDKAPLEYLDGLCEYVEETREKLPQDTQLQNIVDEIVALLDTTIYKIRRFTQA